MNLHFNHKRQKSHLHEPERGTRKQEELGKELFLCGLEDAFN